MPRSKNFTQYVHTFLTHRQRNIYILEVSKLTRTKVLSDNNDVILLHHLHTHTPEKQGQYNIQILFFLFQQHNKTIKETF